MDLDHRQNRKLQALKKPNQEYNLNFSVIGAFAFPEKWQELDEAHEIFSYKVKFFDMEITGGKTFARQMTEEELAEAEENDPKKKKGKEKKKKGDEEEEELTPEQIEAEKKLAEEKAEKKRLKEEKWAEMNE